MKKVIIHLLSFCFIGSISLTAATKIGSFPIPFLVEGPNDGSHVKAFKAIKEKAGVECELVISPVNRTVADFKSGALAAYFPATTTTMGKAAAGMANKPIETEPYAAKNIIIFSLAGKSIVSLDDLKGKTIGLVSGFTYGPGVEALIAKKGTPDGVKDVVFQDKDALNANLVAKGKIDCFLAEESSGVKAAKSITDAKFSYAKDKPILSIPLFFAFQGSEKDTAAKFSAAIKQLKADGTLEKILIVE